MNEKVNAIIELLKIRYPDAPCALQYGKDYELMIAVRLSAQCTDARVNLITPALFAAYPTLESIANANISDIENYIHSCGFFRQKAKDIVLSCQMLIAEYDGKVPDTMEKLLKLPGVGRKTANLLLGDLYGEPGSVLTVVSSAAFWTQVCKYLLAILLPVLLDIYAEVGLLNMVTLFLISQGTCKQFSI